MSKQKKKIDLSQKVMAKIQKDQIQVQPKWQFMLGSFLMAFGLFTAMALTIYLISLSWYRVRIHSSLNYLWFGRDGLSAFWSTFPWLYLVLAVISLMVGIWVVKKYDFSYKMKWEWVLLGLIFGVLTAGVVIDGLGMNRHLAKQELARPMYMEYSKSQDWYKGEVKRVGMRQMIITTMGAERQVRVLWNDYTKLPFGSEFSAGEWVIIIGDWEGQDFVAEGIEEVGSPEENE